MTATVHNSKRMFNGKKRRHTAGHTHGYDCCVCVFFLVADQMSYNENCKVGTHTPLVLGTFSGTHLVYINNNIFASLN